MMFCEIVLLFELSSNIIPSATLLFTVLLKTKFSLATHIAIPLSNESITMLLNIKTDDAWIIPILEDVRYPQNYAKSIFSNIDLIYQDISQPNQAEIAIKNCNYYLKKDGILIFAIKSQSIDSIRKSEDVYAQEKKILEEAGYNIIESVNIYRYAAKHIILIVKRGNT